jgi:hypothetical protein
MEYNSRLTLRLARVALYGLPPFTPEDRPTNFYLFAGERKYAIATINLSLRSGPGVSSDSHTEPDYNPKTLNQWRN